MRRVVLRALANVSAGKTEGLERQFRRDATFCFSGEHALGGELHGRKQIAAWFARSRRLFPDHRLTPLDIIVRGGPWATTVAVRFRVNATLPDGEAYENEGMQYLRLRWGSIVEDRLYEDTKRLCTALQSIARGNGNEFLTPSQQEDAPLEGFG